MLATEFVDWISGVTNYLNSDNCPDSLRFGVANITEDMDILDLIWMLMYLKFYICFHLVLKRENHI